MPLKSLKPSLKENQRFPSKGDLEKLK